MITSAPASYAQSYDYYNPFMAAMIVADDGTRYPLWTRGMDGAAFNIPTHQNIGDLHALSFVTEIVVETQLGYIPRIAVTLSPPYEDAIRLLDSTLVEFGNNRLQVQFGYATSGQNGTPLLSEVYEGLMLKPDISIGTDTTIVLNAQGVGAWAAHMQEGGRTWTNMTRRQIIADVCADFNIVPNFEAITNDPALSTMLVDKITMSQGWQTGWFVIDKLCKEGRCFFYSRHISKNADGRTGELVIIPRSTIAVDNPAVTLTMFHIDRGRLSGDQYPILSASTDTAALWLPGAQKIMLQDIDPKTKLPNLKLIDNSETKTPQTGKGGVEVADSNSFRSDAANKQGVVRRSGNPVQDTAVQQAHSAFESMSSLGGISLEVETLGVPLLQPGSSVCVRGLGLKLDKDAYCVHKITHTLGVGGFSTRLSLKSNTTPFVKAQLQIPGSGQENPAQPEANNQAEGTEKKAQQGP
jgi:hypothetical protein